MDGLEQEIKTKISHIAKELAEKIGRPIHEVEEAMHSALSHVLPHLTRKQKLLLRKHIDRIFGPTLVPFIYYSVSAGHPKPEFILPMILAGAWIGFIDSLEAQKEIKKLEEKELEELKKKQLREVI